MALTGYHVKFWFENVDGERMLEPELRPGSSPIWHWPSRVTGIYHCVDFDSFVL